jgi:hypothetical protein
MEAYHQGGHYFKIYWTWMNSETNKMTERMDLGYLKDWTILKIEGGKEKKT